MRAKSTLASNSHNSALVDKVSIWKDKVAVLIPGLPREKPAINSKVATEIYSAILNEKAVKIKYQAWNRDEPNEQLISPQGLFIRGQLIYIYAVNHNKIENLVPIIYLLNRINEAIIVAEKFHKIQKFNVQQYLDKNAFGVLLEKEKNKIILKIKVDKYALKTLIEQPLSKDQKIRAHNDEWSTLTATVNNTLELKQWVMSHGHHTEVIKPAELRQEIKSSIEVMTIMYRK